MSEQRTEGNARRRSGGEPTLAEYAVGFDTAHVLLAWEANKITEAEAAKCLNCDFATLDALRSRAIEYGREVIAWRREYDAKINEGDQQRETPQ